MRHFLIIALLLGLTACFKKEITIKKPSTSGTVSQIEMGSNYGNQLFFNIEENEIVRLNNRETWDLGFESLTAGNHIVLNSSKLMSAAKTVSNDLAAVNTTSGLTFKFDNPSGNFDSTAFEGEWELDVVYVINRGVSTAGNPLGYLKLKLIEVTSEYYQFQWAFLTSSQIQTSTVTRSETQNFTCYSFEDGGGIVDIEPASLDWQLCFTTYTHLYHDGTPYLVCGVLSNRNQVEVQSIDAPFDAISYTTVNPLVFNSKINVIGFDWKVYDFELGMYTIDPTKSFVVKTQNSRFYKLRFIDFYTISGVKGAPKFELVELIP